MIIFYRFIDFILLIFETFLILSQKYASLSQDNTSCSSRQMSSHLAFCCSNYTGFQYWCVYPKHIYFQKTIVGKTEMCADLSLYQQLTVKQQPNEKLSHSQCKPISYTVCSNS